jgi:hypothetical protein
MASNWIIKPKGPHQLDVTVPDEITVEEELEELDPHQLLRALSQWMELQEKRSATGAGRAWCLGGCGVQAGRQADVQ